MTQEALKLALEALDDLLYWDNGKPEYDEARKALQVGKQALAQTELCKYGQEPKSCTSNPMDCQCAIDASLAQTQEPVAKYSDIVSDGGLDPRNTTPPQRTERPVDCERCNRLEEHAYDLVGKLRVANIKLSMQPQRTWVGLTDEELADCMDMSIQKTCRAIEAKLKDKNPRD